MPASERLALETYRTLLRTSHRVRRTVRALLARYGLTGAQFGTLTRIPPAGIPLTRLAAMSWADPGNISGVVDRLERDGLVRRERSEEDRRVVLVFLTEEGQKVLAELIPRYEAAVSDVMRPLDGAELVVLTRLLTKLAPDSAIGSSNGKPSRGGHGG